MNINLLKEIIAKVGGDVENLPDNLLTTHLKALCEALGVDTSNVKDNLITTLLKAMHGSDVLDDLLTTHLKALCETLGIDTSDIAGNLTSFYLQKILDGEVSGGGSNKTYAGQLYEFYGVDRALYPYMCIYARNGVGIYFGKELPTFGSSFVFRNGYCRQHVTTSETLVDDENYLSQLLEILMSVAVNLTVKDGQSPSIYHDGTNSSMPCYVNVENTGYDTIRTIT